MGRGNTHPQAASIAAGALIVSAPGRTPTSAAPLSMEEHSMADEPKLFPIQAKARNLEWATVSETMYMRAYEIYSHVFSPQRAMIEGGCRGGFAVGELVAFLYAGNFPKEQWRDRVDEAFKGMNL
jgi:hypothetical protein